jgi:hypothetical protein
VDPFGAVARGAAFSMVSVAVPQLSCVTCRRA